MPVADQPTSPVVIHSLLPSVESSKKLDHDWQHYHESKSYLQVMLALCLFPNVNNFHLSFNRHGYAKAMIHATMLHAVLWAVNTGNCPTMLPTNFSKCFFDAHTSIIKPIWYELSRKSRSSCPLSLTCIHLWTAP
jgi:hypothetical protein